MIHAYLHVTKGLNYGTSHGPEFKLHMKKINAQEGTKITIFHNFRKEVDKFRIHVYKCDGPCVSRRPFFGVLRRAIERPPGPGDKWWARHQRECGGTFRKIEGPGAVPSKNSASLSSRKTGRGESKLSGNSVSKSEGVTSKKTKELSNTIKMSGKKFGGKNVHQRSHVNSCKTRKRQNFDEDEVVKKIRDKYANSKQTVLLSKEDAEHLNSVNSTRYQESKHKHERPFSVDGRMKSQATPFGNFVEGNVDYSYQPHSPEINVAKYLNRYREAKRTFGPSLSGSNCNSKGFQITEKSSRAVSNSKELDTLTDSQMKDNRMSFDYNFVSKTPDKIKLGKYIERYRAAVSGVFDLEKSSIPAKHKSKSSQLISLDKRLSDFKQDSSSYSGTSKTTKCPVCYNHIPASKYEQHLKTCSANDCDSDIEILDEKQLKSVQSTISKNRKTLPHIVSESMQDERTNAKNCPNCGSKVLVAELKLHLEYCAESDSDSDIVELPQKSTRATKKEQQCKISRPLDVGVVSCPSCAKMVKEEKLQEHLDECLQFFSEEF